MAQETKCLTNGAQFHIHVMSQDDTVKVEVSLPKHTLWDVDEKEAELLSRLIHNQLELVLRPYFMKRNREYEAHTAERLVSEAHAKLKLV